MAKKGCKIQKNAKNNKINGVLNQEGEKSLLFQQIFNTPTLSLDESIDVYKNIFSNKFKPVEAEQVIAEEVVTEPIEVQVSEAKVEIKPLKFLTASQMKKAETSEKMMAIKEKQDGLKKRFEELEKLNNCLWS